MKRPELKQFGNLTISDFMRYPVWIGVHTDDCEEPWYNDDDVNEETFRPCEMPIPVSPSNGMFLVKCNLKLCDGTVYEGFVTPANEKGKLGLMQPQLFLGREIVSFWGGMCGIEEAKRQAFYNAVGKNIKSIFPISFSALPGLTKGEASGTIEGFYKLANNREILEY